MLYIFQAYEDLYMNVCELFETLDLYVGCILGTGNG